MQDGLNFKQIQFFIETELNLSLDIFVPLIHLKLEILKFSSTQSNKMKKKLAYQITHTINYNRIE